jgi:lipopolysaccharide/colanic/teichoic acid biosynthesis glycosyltransferase
VKRSHRVYDTVKRFVDAVVAAVLLVVLSPILLVTAVVVRVKLGSPVLFTQQRPGRGGRPFTVYKFRSMRQAADGVGDVAAVGSDADRLTRTGRILRSSSLDELPELVNVVRGDMSVVGPRPLLTEYLPRYNERQARRHEVRPGITGWAQVNGRNAVGWDDRFEMDVWYVDHRSFALDARVLARTFGAVFGRRDISAKGQATMEPFDPQRDADHTREDS